MKLNYKERNVCLRQMTLLYEGEKETVIKITFVFMSYKTL